MSALDLRILGCIAYHDRMSAVRGKGQGAWASNATLARRVQCHYTNLSSSITKLGQLGYVEKLPHPLNKRLRVYRVIYGDAPELVDALPDDKVLSGSGQETVCGSTNGLPVTVCHTSENTPRSQRDDPVEYISLSDVRYSAEAGKNIQHKLRAADAPRLLGGKRLFADGEPVHETLAKFERQWKQDWTVFKDSLAAWCEWLLSQADLCAGADDIASARAQRLADTVSEWMENLAWERGERG